MKPDTKFDKKLEIKEDWLTSARQVVSPNFDERPENTQPDLLVIHCISLPPDEYGGPWIDQLFTNSLESEAHPYFNEIRGMKVSCHALIRRTGEIIQYVPFTKRAWHAGESSYENKCNCNDFSIGIELEGSENSPFEEIQYKILAQLTQRILEQYPKITKQRITGHSDIAPGRKKDPGPYFDWTKYHSLIDELIDEIDNI